MRQVNPRGIEVVGQERAGLASFFPVGSEHEMVDDQLAAAGEQIGERLRAVRAFEHVVLLDPFPRQFAALPAQFVPFPGEFLFSGQVRQARLQPFVSRHHFVVSLRCSHRISFLWLGTGTRLLAGPCGVIG